MAKTAVGFARCTWKAGSGILLPAPPGQLPRGHARLHADPHQPISREVSTTEEVEVHRGAWNTEHHWGGDFTQWTGSLLQKKGWDEVRRASEYYWQVKQAFDQRTAAVDNPEQIRDLIVRAYDHLLTAETSCNFYWGSRWVHRSFDDLEQVYYLLDTAMAKLDAT